MTQKARPHELRAGSKGGPSNRAKRRAHGIGVGASSTTAAFRRPSARVRARSCPFDPTPAQRPGKARKLAEAERVAVETAAAFGRFADAVGKFGTALAPFAHKRMTPVEEYHAPDRVTMVDGPVIIA